MTKVTSFSEMFPVPHAGISDDIACTIQSAWSFNPAWGKAWFDRCPYPPSPAMPPPGFVESYGLPLLMPLGIVTCALISALLCLWRRAVLKRQAIRETFLAEVTWKERGAYARKIKALPMLTLGEEFVATEERKCCAICSKDYVSGDVLRRLPCGHEFCKDCIDEWLLQLNFDPKRRKTWEERRQVYYEKKAPMRACPLCKAFPLTDEMLMKPDDPESDEQLKSDGLA